MSYEPTNWKTGDVVTASKLNNIENGITTERSHPTMIVNDILDDGIRRLDKTYEEICDAFTDGTYVILQGNFEFVQYPDPEGEPVRFNADASVALNHTDYNYDWGIGETIYDIYFGASMQYRCTSPNDYPVCQ